MIRAHLTTQFYFFRLSLLFVLFGTSVNLSAQATYYWVGGTGNWSDLTHWATTSGGVVKHTIVPSQLNDVVFDANSFTAAGQTVTVNQAPFCKNFVWNGVTNNPTFVTTGYDLSIFGAFRQLGGSFTFTQNSTNALTITDSLVVNANINFNKSGGVFTVGKGVFMNNLTSATTFNATSSALSITTGNFELNNVSASSVRFLSLTISNGSCAVNGCGAALFNWGNTSIPLGSFKVKTWSGVTFQLGTISISQDTFLIDNWTSGSFSASTINCNGAKFHLSDWSGTASNFSSGSISTTTGGVKIKNWNANNINVGAITLAVDSFLIDNWDRGNFTSSTINCGAAKFQVKDWSGSTFNCTSNISTTTGGVKIINWAGGNFQVSGSITLSQDSFLIENWDSGNFSSSTINCNAAKFHIKDWSGAGSSFYCNSNLSTTSSFKIKNWTQGSFQVAGTITAALDTFLVNAWSGTSFAANGGISCGNARFQLSNWTAGSFSTGNITANVDSVVVRNWTAGNFSCSTISASAKGVLFENWNSGNISAAFNHNAMDLILKNILPATTLTLSTTSDIRKIVFDNAPINFNGSTNQLTIRNDFDLAGTGVKYSHAGSLIIYGNMNLTGATSFSHTGTTTFLSTSVSAGINLSTFSLGSVTFGSTGTFTMNSMFRATATVSHNAGTLISNGFRMNFGNVYDGFSSSSNKTLNLTGTDTVYVGYSFRLNSGAGTVFIKDLVVLKIESNQAATHIVEIPGKSLNDVVVNTLSTTTSIYDVQFAGTNAVFGNVKIKNNNNFRVYFNATGASYGQLTIDYPTSNANLKTVYLNTNAFFGNFTFTNASGTSEMVTLLNNTFGDVVLPISTVWTSTAGRTQTVASLTLNGNCGLSAFIKSSTSAMTTFTDVSGTNAFDYLQTQYVAFSGGATWSATNSITSNTTGLTLSAFASRTLYWIGNGGNWTDPAHWSLSSGGATANCTPNSQDSIVFDVNSFTLTNQQVTINLDVTHKAITVNNVLNNPLLFSSGRIILLTSNLTFMGTTSRFTHNSSSLQIQGNIINNGSNVTWNSSTVTVTGDFSIKNTTGGSYTFSSANLTIGDSLIIQNAVLSTFSVGSALQLTSGSIDMKSSTVTTFSVGSNLTLTNGSITLLSTNFTTFNVSANITASNGQFLLQQGAIANFTTRTATLKGFKIISSTSGNYTFNNFSTSSSNLLNLTDSLVIRNSTLSTFYLQYFYSPGGYYVYHNVNITSGSFYVSNSSITNFIARNINVSNGSIEFESNSAGNFNTAFTCSSDFQIKDSPVNWSITNFTDATASAGGNFTISNSQCSFNAYRNFINVTGNFLIETKPVTWTSQYPVTVNGDYSVLNSSSSITLTNYYPATLYVRGNFTLNSAMTYSVYATNFTAITTGKTINPAGKIFTNVNFTGNGGAWTMLNDFVATGDVSHQFGTFISNGYKVDYGLGLNANYSNLLTLNYTGTDTIRAKAYYTLSASANTTLTIASAVIKINTANTNVTASFNGGGKTFNDVYLVQSGLTYANGISISGTNTKYENLYIFLDRNGPVNFNNGTLYYKDVYVDYRSANSATSSISITGANTWYDLRVTSPKVLLTTVISASNTFDTLAMPNGTSFTFQSGITQNWNAFVTDGLCDNIPAYKSSTAGSQATLNDLNGGTTNLNYINIKDIKITGGTWNASNVINGGNNTGINITASASMTYYWIGNGGNWTDPAHWSLSSGGAAGACIPTLNDDVVFDIFSFSSNSQTVNVTAPITVRNMTWTSGVNRNPTFNPATLNVLGDLNIQGQVTINTSTTATIGGDFILNQNLTWSSLSVLNLVSDSLNNIINFGTKTFNCNTTFNSINTGITPKWTLASAFSINNTTSNTTVFTAGEFISNGFNVNFGRAFDASVGTRIRNLNFTGSAEVRAGYDWRISTNGNTTLNMGTSKLVLDYNTTYITLNFSGGNRVYYDVELHKYYNNGFTGYHANINDNNTFNSLLVNWRPSAAENLNILGTQTIGTFTANFESSPFTAISITLSSNSNQINTFNLTTRGNQTTNININGTGQNITTYNVNHLSTGTLNSNFQTGSHTIGALNLTATSGALTTSFLNGAHTVGNTSITSSTGTITTNMQGANAFYGNYTATTGSSGASTLNLTNAMTAGDITMQSVNGTSRIVSQTGNKTFGKVKITTTGTGIPDPEFYSNTTMDRLELSQGFDMFIGSNTNIGITNDFLAYSSCARPSRIIGQNQTTSKITKASGAVIINYGVLQTHTVTGGASFTASNTVATNTTGWTASAEPPLTYYWIGGSGNWNEVSHWSFTSGGVSNGCKIPEPEDNVVFDQNSFTAANQFVNLNQNATVNNMIWSGVLFNPGFGASDYYSYNISLTINGDLIINDQMRWSWAKRYYAISYGSSYFDNLYLKGSFKLNSSVTWNHDHYLYFNTSSGSHEIDLAGKVFNESVFFQGVAGSELVLENNFTVNSTYPTTFTTGKLISNGFDVDFGRSLLANNTGAKELDFTNTANIRVREVWEVNTNANNVLKMGTSHLRLQSTLASNFIFRSGNKTYNDVTIQHDNTSNLSISIEGAGTFDDFVVGYVNRKDVTISGSNTFATFTLQQNYDPTNNIPLFNVTAANTFNTFVILSLGIQGPTATFTTANTFGNFISVGRNTRIKFAANLTQTFNGPMQVLGTGGQPIFMQSTLDGTRATISRANDNMCFDYIWIKDINATGGATYLGGLNGVDLGNNMGITFNDNCAGYYWVGGSGDWSDVNHWATSSGGSIKQMVPPTLVDHVFFDANSFSAAGQTVNLDIDGVCANMTWLSALFNPTFAGSASTLEINGNLTLSPNMTISWPGEWKLKGTTVINTVDLKGKQLPLLTFDANQSTGGYAILQPITITNSLTLSDGELYTNGQTINTNHFVINTTNSKLLNLGASEIRINEGSWNVQDNTAITLNAGTSTIKLLSNAADVDFYGGGLSYNNVSFVTTTTMSSDVTGNNTYNNFTAGGSTHLTLESGSIQTAANFVLGGDCGDYLIMDASVSGNEATLSKTSGVVDSRFLNLTDIHTTGGANFNATFSINNANNTGWNFINLPAFSFTLSPTNPTCPTPNNGSITAVVTGGVSPYIYRWSNLATTATISNLSPGTYTVTVTDDAGCSASQSVVLSQPSSYGFLASASGSTVCFGEMTGTLLANAPTAVTPLTYLWNNGATIAAPTNLTAGVYAVTVTDANNCTATASATVASYAQLTASYSNTVSNCTNVAMTFTGLPNTAGYQYGWTFGDGNTANVRIATNTFAAAGTYPVVLTVTDLNGCTDTESKQIVVVNPPSFTATTVSTTTCVGCNGLVNLNITQGTAPYTIVGSTPVSSLCAGNYSYQIRDANQCLSPIQSYTVSLNDLTKPTISGLTSKSSVVNTGCTATGINLGSPTLSDDCSSTANITIANNVPMGGIYPIGLTTVVWTATDQAGNTQTFNQIVTVTASDINLTGNGMSIPDEDITPDLGDNTDFGETNIGSFVTKTFNIQNLGTAILSLTGSPRVTVKNNVHFSVSVQPSAASIAVSGGALNFTVKYQPTAAGTHTDTVIVLSNDCDEGIYRFVVTGKVDCSISIDNVIAVDEGCPGSDDGSLEISASCLSCGSVADIRYSIDNTDFTNTTGLFEFLPPGSYTTYVRDVNDIACNTSSGPHLIEPGVDAILPQIVCPSNINVNTALNTCGAVVNYTTPIGTDNCGGATTMQTAGLADGATFPLGVSTNTFEVTDGSGNSASCSFVVTVSDNQAPQIICPSNINVNTALNTCGAMVNYTTAIGTDNCSGSSTMQTSGLSDGATFPLGVTTNTFEVTDGSGNSASCSFTITVTDNQAPTITCPNNITVDTDAGLCTASGLSLGNALVADNCNGSIVPTHNGSEPYIRGINNITWSADDGNGNISTCLQTVTVLFPEINLTGNGLNILNGDNTTNALDFTDFGPQSPGSITDKTFYIQNLGSQTLQLSGAPLVMVSGDAEFSIFSQPMSGTILAGGPDLSFVVRYAPTAAGNHTAMVTVFNNDCDEPVYTFAISSCATTLYYKDQDGDGYGNADSILAECSQPVGYVTNGNDCNDNAASLNIQPVVYSHDGICYATLEDALAIAGSAVMQEVLIHADASPNEINTIPTGVTVRVLTGTWNNHMMLKNNGIIILENGASFINVPGGVYKGRGVFNGNFLNSGGKVSPGE